MTAMSKTSSLFANLRQKTRRTARMSGRPLDLAPAAPSTAPVDADEVRAVEIAMNGTNLQRLGIGFRSLYNLLRNPEDTRQVFIMNIMLNRNHIPTTMFRMITAPGGLELLHTQPAIDSTTIDLHEMAKLPEGTLGHAYAHHLLDRGLDGDIFQAPPGLPPAVAFLGKRGRQSHDIWHVLTGYGTDVPGEVALQAFTYGQVGAPGPGLTALAGTLRWGLQHPGMARLAWDGYQRGKAAKFLLAVHWEDLWEVPLETVRRDLEIAPAKV